VTFLFFGLACAALMAIPGPNVLFLMACGISGGRRAAVRSVFGLHAATACFVTAAACGVTALLVSSAVAFAIVKYAGAGYLLFLGLRSLRRSGAAAPAGAPGFRRAFLVGISNPKVAVFVAAILPQFGTSVSMVVLLGVELLVIAVVLDLGWALLAGAVGPRLGRRLRWLPAPVYLGLGTYTALTA
jgi:threonine/homoserine/homoserine lactone efflux protein